MDQKRVGGSGDGNSEHWRAIKCVDDEENPFVFLRYKVKLKWKRKTRERRRKWERTKWTRPRRMDGWFVCLTLSSWKHREENSQNERDRFNANVSVRRFVCLTQWLCRCNVGQHLEEQESLAISIPLSNLWKKHRWDELLRSVVPTCHFLSDFNIHFHERSFTQWRRRRRRRRRRRWTTKSGFSSHVLMHLRQNGRRWRAIDARKGNREKQRKNF